jgi:hypothetical protein
MSLIAKALQIVAKPAFTGALAGKEQAIHSGHFSSLAADGQ